MARLAHDVALLDADAGGGGGQPGAPAVARVAPRVQSGHLRALLDHQRHDPIAQPAAADASPARHSTEDWSIRDRTGLQPRLERPRWAALRLLAAGNSLQLADALLARLRPPQSQHQAPAGEAQVGHIQADQLRAPEGAAEAD